MDVTVVPKLNLAIHFCNDAGDQHTPASCARATSGAPDHLTTLPKKKLPDPHHHHKWPLLNGW
jgi:hypothetical protein